MSGSRADLVTIGETMVSFVGRDDPRTYEAIPAGAESNVAAGFARLGGAARWVSRLGDDPLGRYVEREIAAAGVGLDVVRDPDRPTGVMTKHVGAERRTAYYRRGSAASALSADDIGRIPAARFVHLTGITPALSDSAAALVAALLDGSAGVDGLMSFDVNHRPALWPDAVSAGRTLEPLARSADIVFVGDDEAEAVFGTSEVDDLARRLLTGVDQQLVLRRGAGPASVVTAAGVVSEPALPVDVIDPTGAGDAFVAGFLFASNAGWPPASRLQLGHFMASRVLGVIDDLVPPFEPHEVEALSPGWLDDRWSERG